MTDSTLLITEPDTFKDRTSETRTKSGARSVLAGMALSLAAGLMTGIAAPGGFGVSTAAAQSSCQIDFGILQKKRMAQIQALNASVKRNKGKLDARTACPRLRRLAAVEREMVAYMKKNKNWCQIPDEPIKQMTTTSAKTAKTAGDACRAVAMARKAAAQARGAAQSNAIQRPKLPSGPL